ncbi:MAG: hypothetical protein ABI643_00420 [Candidatus Doudnabacteria bacterium]
MRPTIWLLSLFILLVVQAGVLMPLHLSPVNLVLIMAVVSTLLAGFNLGLGLTIAGGLFLDFLSGTPDGLVTMTMVCVFLLLYFIVNSVLARESSQIILFTSVAASTIVYFIIFLVMNRLFGIFRLSTALDYNYVFKVDLPLTLMFNLIFTYPVFKYYLFTEKLTKKFGKHSPRLNLYE